MLTEPEGCIYLFIFKTSHGGRSKDQAPWFSVTEGPCHPPSWRVCKQGYGFLRCRDSWGCWWRSEGRAHGCLGSDCLQWTVTTKNCPAHNASSVHTEKPERLKDPVFPTLRNRITSDGWQGGLDCRGRYSTVAPPLGKRMEASPWTSPPSPRLTGWVTCSFLNPS